MKHLNIIITGKVQKVGFRFIASTTAKQYQVSGFVRNSGHDKVYMEVEGSNDNLDQFLKWCAKGPAGSRIDIIEVAEDTYKHFSDFTILSRID